MQNGAYRPRQLPFAPPAHHTHTLIDPEVEALRSEAQRLRNRVDQAMAAGHWDVAARLEEQAALAEHRAGLISEDPLTVFGSN